MSCKGGCGQMPNTVMLRLEVLKIPGIVTNGDLTARANAVYKFAKGGISDKKLDAEPERKGQTPGARQAFLNSLVNPKTPNYVWSQFLIDERVHGTNPQLGALLSLAGLKLHMNATELGEWIRNGA